MSALRKDLRAIAADGAASSVMVGIGENYLPAFVLALTASQLACGLAATVPLLIGAALQLIAPAMIGRWRSYRRWVVVCAALQAAIFLPLVVLALKGAAPVLLVFALASLYWATGFAGGPAWNTWVAALIPGRIRPQYLARRSRLAQAGVLAGLLGGGIALQLGTQNNEPVRTFALLFLVAAASRMLSTRFLAVQRESYPMTPPPHIPFQRRPERAAEGKVPRQVLIYMLLVQMAVYVSGPYFTPYMLCRLELSYGGYVMLTCTAYVAKILALPAFGAVAARFGVQRLMWIGGSAIVPTAALWLVSDSFPYLIGVQALSGVAWAAFELATLLLFVDTIPVHKRVRVLTLYNLGNAAAIFTGSLLGGILLKLLGEQKDAYLVLFALSSVGRMAALLVFARAAAVLRPAPVPAQSPAVALATDH